MRVELTDRFVKAAKSPGAPQADYFDAGTPGLALRVSTGGRKAWSFVYTSPKDGRRARVTLGSYPTLSLASARGRALEVRGYLAEKPPRDPRDVLLAESDGAMTVQALIDSYLAKHVRPNRRSADETERRFARNVSPVIGGVKLAELHRRDINRTIDPILRRESPVEATRTFEDVRAMLRWAVKRGDMDRSPMEGMGKPAKSQPRERVLSDDEIKKLWNGLPKTLAKSKTCQRVLKLCLLTAQRVGEVSGMSRDELDMKAAVWTIPSARSKNGHEHSVPLAPLAVELITEALAAAGSDSKFVFPAEDAKQSFPAAAVARTIVRASKIDDEHPLGRFEIAHWTAHDLRRTAVSNMAKLGIAPIVLGHVVNHRSVTRAGVTLSVYSHYDHAKEKREALQLWAERLTALTNASAAATITTMNRQTK